MNKGSAGSVADASVCGLVYRLVCHYRLPPAAEKQLDNLHLLMNRGTLARK